MTVLLLDEASEGDVTWSSLSRKVKISPAARILMTTELCILLSLSHSLSSIPLADSEERRKICLIQCSFGVRSKQIQHHTGKLEGIITECYYVIKRAGCVS